MNREKSLQILDLQPQISKVFAQSLEQIFSHSRSEQFWLQNTIFYLPEGLFEPQIFSNFPAHNLNIQGRKEG